MKFIRDIIAEKTNMAEKGPAPEDMVADPSVNDDASVLSEDIDPVHMVASGGTSLGHEGHFADLDELPMGALAGTDTAQEEVGEDIFAQGSPAVEGGFDDDDGFDLLSDPQDEGTLDDAAAGSGEDPDSAELFADIWGEDQGTQEPKDSDFNAAQSPAVSAPDVSDPTPEPEPAQSNVDALMQTMYPHESELAPEILVNPVTIEAAPDQPEAMEEPQDTSAFQRIMRRQKSIPPESVSKAMPESTPVSTPEPTLEQTPQPTPPPAPAPMPETMRAAQPAERVNVPAPAAGRGRRQAGRVKTRLLGFGNDQAGETDLFAAKEPAQPAAQTMYPVGWMVVVSGPGRGNAFTLFNGVSQIGRGEDQAVRLDFGDNSISRANHAAIAYDPEQQAFFLGHGGKANLVRLNDTPVLSTEPLQSGALIRIGETTLRFVALCGDGFDWSKDQQEERDNARFG